MKRFIAMITATIIAITLCSCAKTDSNTDNYNNDIKKYQAGSFMPDLNDIGNYKEIDYFSKKNEALFRNIQCN